MALVLNKNLGMLLLGIWLVLHGLVALFGLTFGGLGVILGILALAAGALILLGK
jgi:hypothetical protein